jgi:Uma2 family endonuclease
MLMRKRDTRRHSYSDYFKWPEVYGELIDGIGYVREPPAPSRLHQELVGELYLQIRAALKGRPCRAYVAPFDVRLPKSNEPDDQIDTVVQPDIFIVCDLGKLDERGMRGAPDWVAEVLSPGTARHDQILKLAVYERARVAEVWLIHPTDRTLSLYRLAGERYGPPTLLQWRGKTKMTAVPEVSIDWEQVLDGLQ